MNLDFFLPLECNINGLDLIGTSRAGIGTSLYFPQLSIAMDVASGFEAAIPAKLFLISHGHMDHAGGIPYLISQRGLNGLPKGRFVMPPEIIAPVTGIMKLWESIEHFDYSFEFLEAVPGQDINLISGYLITPFRTIHRVPSVGYSVAVLKKRLKAEFIGLSQFELKRLSKEGIELSEHYRESILAFTGDTQVEVIEQQELLRKSQTVFMEVTYYDNRKPVAEARKWGHTHFDEILERLDFFECQNLVFIHPSRRYTRSQINEILNRRLPSTWIEKVKVFGL